MGIACYHVLPSRRTMAMRNMEIAFPDKSRDERKRLVRKTFINLAEAMALNTLIMSGRVTDRQLLDMVETEGWDLFKELNRTASKGVLFYSAHLGNWELMPQYMALSSDKLLHVIARKHNNDLMEERILKPLREHYGVNVFYKKNALMKIMKVINKGEYAGILIDQRLNLRTGVPIAFFGRKAGSTATPALLQIRFGIKTVPIFMVKSGRRKYRLIINDPIEWTDNGKPMKEQVLELTRIHQKTIEDMIVRYPDQWFWVHNRWGLEKKKR
jgi:KDO2-lipid IV(A) lauroyltransferase